MGETTLRAAYAESGARSACCRYFTVYGERGHEAMERTRVIDAAREVLRYTGHSAAIALQPDMPSGYFASNDREHVRSALARMLTSR